MVITSEFPGRLIVSFGDELRVAQGCKVDDIPAIDQTAMKVRIESNQ
jgi:hypothetical protein